ncbi:S8 family peptidase [Cryobacterium fucosi]|uniref:S8 family peptidase n=1 Tax=Cryobacterium fucosi TaxID=1259157 RepID=A0A4R9BAP6_9MICO|nr:S8 family peptidase [Cryobacterium fucosi]TFD79213.1 S8 family peptidase [Cryobacterium fucosi]
MAEVGRDLDHLYVHGYAEAADFHRKISPRAKRRVVSRGEHGAGLKNSAEDAFTSFDADLDERIPTDDELRATGTVIVLEGEGATFPLKIDSLNAYTSGRARKPKWLLLSVRGGRDSEPELATVWVSDAYRQEFLKLFQDFLDVETIKGNPKNQDLIANISRIRRAVLSDLWTSEGEPARSGTHWWELWLDSDSEHLATLDGFVQTYRMRSLSRSLRLRDRVIVWVEASWKQLEILPFTSVPIMEIRKPEFIDTVEDLSADEQLDYVTDLAGRIVPASEDAPAVCHLDTGVMRTHALLRDSLSIADHHTIFGSEATASDVHERGHGTSMAGLALFGDLEPLLVASNEVRLRHRLESVRMWPTKSEHQQQPLDLASATVQAAALPEVVSQRRRVYCLTLSTAPDRPGEPTLWSASVDALAVGTDSTRDGDQIQLLSEPDFDQARLILVAAGNVAPPYIDDHRTYSATSPIEDPAQAWNALTVGAYTDLVELPTHPQYAGWAAIAGAGDLSPHSRTSTFFDRNRWPIKPDICMEGGNVLSDGAGGYHERHSSLSLRSTGHTSDVALTSANATSAATAQAARLAALAMDRYPAYWPETIRGMLTHSAEWTESMKRDLDVDHRKGSRHHLLRQFGWGVPTEETVLNSSRRAVTLVTQDEFVPFEGSSYAMRQFRLHSLPWPTDILQDLGEAEVRLRVTLSYFVEPSASRRGWRNKYTYPSHRLQFDLQGRTENQTEFVARVNREAQNSEEGSAPGQNESERWFLGAQARHLGSLHQDEWHGTGAELAHCNNVAVYPVGGWWKNNHRVDRRDTPVRYSLLLSLQTKEQGVDLYAPIATQLHVPIATAIAAT